MGSLDGYPRFNIPGVTKPFNPLKLAKWTEEIVCRRNRDGFQERKYTDFYVAGVYRGIVTGGAVGCCLRCFYCWVPLSREYPERFGRYYDPRRVAKIMSYLAREYRVYKARISCCEPTIGMDHLIQVLRLVEEDRNIKLFILETNGIIFGAYPEYVGEIAKFKKVYVRVSIKAGTPEGFEWRTGAEGRFYELPFKAVKHLWENNIRFHVAAMTDPRIMTPDERRIILEKLSKISPWLAENLEEEDIDPYDTTLIRLYKAGILHKVFPTYKVVEEE